MEIRRITAQSETLADFYDRMATDARTSPDFAELARRMLELLRLLAGIEGPAMWAVTSHANLHLVASDDYQLPSVVEIRGGGFGEAFSFGIEYLMPDSEAPWPGARVLLGSNEVLLACEMVAYGLSKATGVTYTFRNPAEPHAAPDRCT